MIKKIKQPFATIAAVVVLCFATVFATVPDVSAASVTITGSVQCLYGNNQVVGIWVDATSGTDGWATLTDDGIGGKNYSYTMSQSSSYNLHVGCSGSPEAWGSNIETGVISGSGYDWICTYQTEPGFFCYTT